MHRTARATYLDDDPQGFTTCPDCHTQTGEHAQGCPSDPLGSEITPDVADRMRAEYEAGEREKAAARQRERDEWFRQLARARDRMARGETARQQEELAADRAWARSVLVDGETFTTGGALFLALYNAKKASVAHSLSFTEVARLRRLVLALYPEVAESSDMAVARAEVA